MLTRVQDWLEGVFETAHMPTRRPEIGPNRESNIPGIFIIGDLAGAPVIKLAMEHGVAVIDHIASLPDARATRSDAYDVIVVGAGAAGLNAVLEAQDRGLRCLVIEKSKIASTIEDFPEGKWIYAEPDEAPPKGKLWIDGATKEDLIARWQQIVRDNKLDVRTGDGLASITRHRDNHFTLKTEKGHEHKTRRIVLATGQRGNPRCLETPGEDREQVYHRLYSPKLYKDENILVVGGGNSAVEAALTLAERNRVTLSYRGGEFYRLFKDNERKLHEAVAAGRIEVIYRSNVTEFGEKEAALKVERAGTSPAPTQTQDRRDGVGEGLAPSRDASVTEGVQGSLGDARDKLHPSSKRTHSDRMVSYDHAFVLIGSEFPAHFLKSLGIRLENEWTGSFTLSAGLTLATLAGLWIFGGQASVDAVRQMPSGVGGLLAASAFATLLLTGFRGSRWSWLGVSFLFFYALYGIKEGSNGAGREFWPFSGWAYPLFAWFERPMSFWYTVLYTAVLSIFGVQAMKRWGFDRKDKFQIRRYTSLIAFQWSFFFLIPEFLFQWAVKYQWVGERLATDPNFAENAWRSYGLALAWPLFFFTFFYDPHWVWVAWGLLLSFVILPALVLWHGKRYCTWICGCGGLAETLGDRWRHLAPKGRASLRWERMNAWVLGAALLATAVMLTRDVVTLFQRPADWGVQTYRLIADVWLVGIVPLTLYPFFGGKVWCRYWCPLAKLMEFASRFYVRFGISRFGIRANEKCIACGDCTRNCQVGIDVMNFAMKQETITNSNSSCIGCGICVTVCPMDVLTFGPPEPKPQLVQITTAG